MHDDDAHAPHIIGIYQRHAAAFDEDRGRSLFERAWLDRFAALLSPSASVLDIGCGSGEPIARYFLGLGLDVTGVDSSEPLIALCRRRFPDRTWTVADMRSLELGHTFDGLIAWDSFFHLTPDDQRAMFPVFREHAAPSAALMFTSGPAFGRAMGVYHGEPLYHSSLDPTEYRELLHRHGFDVVSHKAEDADCGGRTIWLARLR